MEELIEHASQRAQKAFGRAKVKKVYLTNASLTHGKHIEEAHKHIKTL